MEPKTCGAKSRVQVFADIQNFALRARHSLGAPAWRGLIVAYCCRAATSLLVSYPQVIFMLRSFLFFVTERYQWPKLPPGGGLLFFFDEAAIVLQ